MKAPGAAVIVPLWMAVGFWAGPASAAHAQYLPSTPLTFADGRVTIGGDVSASVGSTDPGFFNYTDYAHSLLRLVRIDLSTSVKAGDHLVLLGDVQSQNLDTVRLYALYLRIRPWMNRPFDIQVGRVPPTFGAFARRTYVSDNVLIGYPLAYQYLTSLRPDALPATVDELLRRRSSGWLVRYSIGNRDPDHGVPLVSAFRWDTGVQLHVSGDLFAATASVTTGTISNPVFPDDNGGKQVAGRVEARPFAGLVVGSSIARGPFVAESAARGATDDSSTADFAQTAWGGDVEYSRAYYLVRVETIFSAWRVPFAAQREVTAALRAMATSVEGRYKVRPGLYAAARLDHLGFSEVTGQTRGTQPWDAPVTRIEVGVGYSIQRNLLLKLCYQHNTREKVAGGRLTPVANQVATQVVYWF